MYGEVSAEEREDITRALKRLKVKPDEDAIKTMAALRTKCKRLNKEKWNEAADMIKQRFKKTEVQIAYWGVHKHLKPDLDTELPATHFVDPLGFDDLPEHLNPHQIWMVDKCVPLGQLGPGVFTIKTTSGSKDFTNHQKKGQKALTNCPTSVLPICGDAKQATAAAGISPDAKPANASDAVIVPSAERKPRLLKASNSDDSVLKAGVAEQAAEDIKRAADQERWVSGDLSDVSSVHGCFKSFVEDYLAPEAAKHKKEKGCMEGFHGALPPHALMLIRFVVKVLEDHDSFDYLPKFKPLLMAITDLDVDAKILPAKTKVLIKMAEPGALTKDTLDLSALNFTQKQSFKQTAVNAGFLRRRFAALFKRVKETHGMPEARFISNSRPLVSFGVSLHIPENAQ